MVIDEFSYLIKKSDIVAEFQTIVDKILQDKNLMLILSGSSVSMMHKNILNKKSPLYGRTTGHIMLQPLQFIHVKQWFKDANIEDISKIYAVCGGVPRYLEFFEGKDAEKEIREHVFNPYSFLFLEPKFLLEEELREPAAYTNILEAIAMGYTKVSEIANFSYLNAKDVSSYLSTLIDLGFVEKEYPVIDKKRVRGIYRMKDNFFDFWFNFVSKYYEKISLGEIEEAVYNFRKRFNGFMGKCFEKICERFIIENRPIKFHRLGRWWHKDKEIDIVALNEDKKEIYFFECKWKKLKEKEAENIIEELKEKAKFVKWFNEERKERYGIFAKKIEGKENLNKKGIIAFDLLDF